MNSIAPLPNESEHGVTNHTAGRPSHAAMPPAFVGGGASAPMAGGMAGTPSAAMPSLDLERLYTSLKSRIWIIAASFFACVVLAIVYLLVTPKYYKSTATIYVEAKREQIAPGAALTDRETKSLDYLKSLEQILVPAVIVQVIEKLELREDKNFLKPLPGGKEYSDADLVRMMEKKAVAKLERGTRNITVSVTDKSPERAQLIAATIVEEFENYLGDQLQDRAGRATTNLREQAEQVRQRALEAASRLQTFREDNLSLPLDENGVIEKSLADLDRQLSDIKKERVQAETELQQLESIDPSKPEKFLEIGAYMKQDQIAKTVTELNSKLGEFERIKSQYKPSSPVYKSAAQEIIGIQKAIQEMGRTTGERIRRRANAAASNELQTAQIVENQKREVLKLEKVRNEYITLKSEVDANWKTYQAILGRINDTTLSQEIRESTVSVKVPPLVPSKAAKPKKSVVLALSGVLGIMLGSGIVIVGHLLDRTFRSRKQVEQILGIPVLADIPQGEEDLSLRDSLYVAHEPTSQIAESFRGLRTSLSALSPRSVLITSAMPGEGKSFTATNLALMQAQLGYRTLLIDADFRKPSLGAAVLQQTGGKTNEPKNVCLPTQHDKLFLLACGRFAPNTGELLTGEHFASMLWEAYRSFDCVIIDSSPLGVVSDALSFARFADAVALVVRSGHTKIGAAQHAADELRRMRAPLAGCVLNGVDERKASLSSYGYAQDKISALPHHQL